MVTPEEEKHDKNNATKSSRYLSNFCQSNNSAMALTHQVMSPINFQAQTHQAPRTRKLRHYWY